MRFVVFALVVGCLARWSLGCAANWGPREESPCGLRPVWCDAAKTICCAETTMCSRDGKCVAVGAPAPTTDAGSDAR